MAGVGDCSFGSRLGRQELGAHRLEGDGHPVEGVAVVAHPGGGVFGEGVDQGPFDGSGDVAEPVGRLPCGSEADGLVQGDGLGQSLPERAGAVCGCQRRPSGLDDVSPSSVGPGAGGAHDPVQRPGVGRLCGPGLFRAQDGVRPHLGEEPVAEVRRGLDHAAAEEVRVGIEEVRRDGEQPSEGHRLLPEDRQRHLVAVFAVRADLLGRHADRHLAERVALVPGEPVRQQVVLDAGERGHALRVTRLAAVARGHRLAVIEQPVERDGDVAEFAGHPGRAFDHLPGLDDSAAEAGADDRGHRAALPGLGAEPHVVRVQRGRVPVVVVDDREPEPFGQRAADVEAAPADMAEVGRALGRDDPVRARGARRVQAHRPHRRDRHAGEPEHLLHGEDQGPDGLVRPFPDLARHLRHPVEKEPAAGIEDGPVVAGPAVIQANDNPVDWHAPS